jgi:hypothetical protein
MNYRNVGIWMDHSEARILEPGKMPAQACVVRSLTESQVREDGQGPDGVRLGNHRSSNNEYAKHNQVREELRNYFRELAKEIEQYEQIFIFGPGTAHSEFANFLMQDPHFREKHISVEKADHMTDMQVEKRVRDFFFREHN